MAGEAHVLRPDERDIPGGAAALAKGLYLLDVIGERDHPARFKDLQIASGLPKGTLSRMLATLVAFRLVRHEPSDNTYRLGNRLFELAHRVWETFDLRGTAAPQLERLAQETRETVALTALDNDQVVYVDQRSQVEVSLETGGWVLSSSSAKLAAKGANKLWSVTVPANGAVHLDYSLRNPHCVLTPPATLLAGGSRPARRR